MSHAFDDGRRDPPRLGAPLPNLWLEPRFGSRRLGRPAGPARRGWLELRARGRLAGPVVGALAAFYHVAERVGRWPWEWPPHLVALLPKRGTADPLDRRPILLLPVRCRLWVASRAGLKRDCLPRGAAADAMAGLLGRYEAHVVGGPVFGPALTFSTWYDRLPLAVLRGGGGPGWGPCSVGWAHAGVLRPCRVRALMVRGLAPGCPAATQWLALVALCAGARERLRPAPRSRRPVAWLGPARLGPLVSARPGLCLRPPGLGSASGGAVAAAWATAGEARPESAGCADGTGRAPRTLFWGPLVKSARGQCGAGGARAAMRPQRARPSTEQRGRRAGRRAREGCFFSCTPLAV